MKEGIFPDSVMMYDSISMTNIHLKADSMMTFAIFS